MAALLRLPRLPMIVRACSDIYECSLTYCPSLSKVIRYSEISDAKKTRKITNLKLQETIELFRKMARHCLIVYFCHYCILCIRSRAPCNKYQEIRLHRG